MIEENVYTCVLGGYKMGGGGGEGTKSLHPLKGGGAQTVRPVKYFANVNIQVFVSRGLYKWSLSSYLLNKSVIFSVFRAPPSADVAVVRVAGGAGGGGPGGDLWQEVLQGGRLLHRQDGARLQVPPG